MEQILALQRAAFLDHGAPTLAQRRASLETLRGAILQHKDAFADAISEDFGHRSRHETVLMEILTLVMGIDYLHSKLRRFMRPTRRAVPLTLRMGRARVEYQPLGVIGIMSPWNYPVSLALMPLATALAAGNRAMIKPSELTPRTSALLATVLGAHFGQETVAVIQGDASVGAAFSGLAFDHLVFTGSTTVGRAVMRAAAANLVPVTLELGGKSPVVVSRGADVARAAARIVHGKLANAGQTCIAPDYALVHEDRLDAFVGAFEAEVKARYPAGTASADYTTIVNDRHHARLTGLVDDARAKGARILASEVSSRPRALAPTLVLGVTDDMHIMQEEIFGPLLPVVVVRSIEDAIGHINARPRPLALYYFGPDDAERRALLARTTSGNVTINGALVHYAVEDLPFGGVGPSGMGAYHGVEGFRALSHAKGVFEQGRWSGADLLRPPFGALADRLLGWLLR